MIIINILFRTILILIILFILAKIMGKKQISQLNLYDYIIGITIGSVAADISLDIEKNIFAGIISLIIYGLSDYLISYLSLKNLSLRNIFFDTPDILIENGKIIEKNLYKNRIDINTLLSEARNNGYFDLDKINYAIMETNGKISFMLKKENEPVTNKDINNKVKDDKLVANIIIDEQLIKDNLKNMNKSIKWLNSELKKQGYNNYKDILLATLDNNNKLIIYKKNIKEKDTNKL